MSKKPVKPTKSDCGGCYNNFYNFGGKTCWHLENATLERKKLVGVDDVPPGRHSQSSWFRLAGVDKEPLPLTPNESSKR